MNTQKHNPVLRLLPSLTDLAFLMPIVFLYAKMEGAKTMLGDGDTGWHIRAGEWMLANLRVPETDLFSYTMAGKPWYAWEWLWDAAFAWLHQQGGMTAVVLASVLVIAATFAMLFRLVARRCGNVLLAIGITMLAAAGASLHWLARPHLFTLLFVVIFLSLLERARQGHVNALAWLLPLTVLWTNLHGGFFIGVMLTGCYAVGELAAAAVTPDPSDRRAALARSAPYALAAAGSLIVSLLNPYTWHLHAHIVSYLSESYHFENINEFFSISFHHPAALYFEIMIVLAIVAGWRALMRRDFTSVFLLAGWMHLALLGARNIPIFMIVAAPVVAAALAELLGDLAQAPVAAWVRRAADSFREMAAEVGEMERVPRLHLVSAAALLLVTLISYSPAAPRRFRAEYDTKAYPSKALSLLATPGFAKAVFTNDEWGDYLIYRLHPNTKVFIDGRSDFYGPEFGRKYLDVMSVKHDWQQSLDRYGVDAVLLPVDSSLAGTLKESRRWRVAYDDGVAIVFRAAARQISTSMASNGTGTETGPTAGSESTTGRQTEKTI